MGAGRLIAATAPRFVPVDRLARCIGHHLSPINVQAGVGLYVSRALPAAQPDAAARDVGGPAWAAGVRGVLF